MLKALLPGTFDPPTYGHFNLIRRASQLCDYLIIGIGRNRAKNQPLLTIEERIEVLEKAVAGLENVRVISFSGLASECAKAEGAAVIIRGLRSMDDLAYEMQMAVANTILSGIESIFLMADIDTSHISSTLIRELAFYGASLGDFIPQELEKIIYSRVQKGEVK